MLCLEIRRGLLVEFVGRFLSLLPVTIACGVGQSCARIELQGTCKIELFVSDWAADSEGRLRVDLNIDANGKSRHVTQPLFHRL
jgi:hypothetical protein